MAHPVTRLTCGTTYRRPDEPRGGKPETEVCEIAQAVAQIDDLISYWAVLAYYCDQHPTGSEWTALLIEMHGLVKEAWKAENGPATKKKHMLGVAESAWVEFISPKAFTAKDRAKVAGIGGEAWRRYARIQARVHNNLVGATNDGLRQIKKALGRH